MTSSSTPPAHSPPTVLRARSPEDLLAVARVVLGFEPADSVVMLTTGAVDAFHARVDLPDRADGVDALHDLAEVLLGPARRHAARSVVLVLFSDDHRWARRAAHTVSHRLRHAGVECLPAVRAHAGRWHPLDGRVRGIDDVGVPYDVSAHPFVVSAVLQGRVIHGSREELAATLTPDPDAVADVEAARGALQGAVDVDPAWIADTVGRHVGAQTRPDPAEAARLLEAIADADRRDAAWGGAVRADARGHVELWSGLVRCCPPDLVPHAAGVLAFLAWLAGDGALAWCGVDRARETDPSHSLARLVSDLLERAVPPSVWEPVLPDLVSRPRSAS